MLNYLQNMQVNNVPGVLADVEITPFIQTNKRGLRVFLEKQFPGAFKLNPNELVCETYYFNHLVVH